MKRLWLNRDWLVRKKIHYDYEHPDDCSRDVQFEIDIIKVANIAARDINNSESNAALRLPLEWRPKNPPVKLSIKDERGYVHAAGKSVNERFALYLIVDEMERLIGDVKQVSNCILGFVGALVRSEYWIWRHTNNVRGLPRQLNSLPRQLNGLLYQTQVVIKDSGFAHEERCNFLKCNSQWEILVSSKRFLDILSALHIGYIRTVALDLPVGQAYALLQSNEVIQIPEPLLGGPFNLLAPMNSQGSRWSAARQLTIECSSDTTLVSVTPPPGTHAQPPCAASPHSVNAAAMPCEPHIQIINGGKVAQYYIGKGGDKDVAYCRQEAQIDIVAADTPLLVPSLYVSAMSIMLLYLLMLSLRGFSSLADDPNSQARLLVIQWVITISASLPAITLTLLITASRHLMTRTLLTGHRTLLALVMIIQLLCIAVSLKEADAPFLGFNILSIALAATSAYTAITFLTFLSTKQAIRSACTRIHTFWRKQHWELRLNSLVFVGWAALESLIILTYHALHSAGERWWEIFIRVYFMPCCWGVLTTVAPGFVNSLRRVWNDESARM